jgi:DNA-binding PadR family transcriptional regulator
MVIKLIKRVKTFLPEAKINSAEYREYIETFESEILRGISTLAILAIIERSGKNGIYGYALLKELEQETQNMLILEEGTMYPILKKLENQGIIEPFKRIHEGRSRNYYTMTESGRGVFNHLMGFLTKLIDSMKSIMGIEVNVLKEHIFYCPNCANKIDLTNREAQFCEMCGLNIENLKKTRIEGKVNKE